MLRIPLLALHHIGNLLHAKIVLKTHVRNKGMGTMLIWSRIKQWIGGIGFELFLWSNKQTVDEYTQEIIQQYTGDNDHDNTTRHAQN